MTRAQLEERLARRRWASTTLLALLGRLEAKGYVTREKQGKGYLYAAALAREDYLPVESRSALERMFGGSASAVKRLLEKLAVPELRLVINRFNSRLFDETGVYSDLDNVIDASSIRLFGVVPEDYSLAAAFLKGKKAEEHSKGMMALCRIAGRLDGETIPLSVF